MAEQADAGGLNPPEGNLLRVRFPLRAPTVCDCSEGFNLYTVGMTSFKVSTAHRIRRLIPVFSLVCATTFVGFSYSAASAAAAAAADVTTGLVAYWNFDNSAAIGQSTTGGTPLTANNGAQYTASGKFGGGLLLNGSSQ